MNSSLRHPQIDRHRERMRRQGYYGAIVLDAALITSVVVKCMVEVLHQVEGPSCAANGNSVFRPVIFNTEDAVKLAFAGIVGVGDAWHVGRSGGEPRDAVEVCVVRPPADIVRQRGGVDRCGVFTRCDIEPAGSLGVVSDVRRVPFAVPHGDETVGDIRIMPYEYSLFDDDVHGSSRLGDESGRDLQLRSRHHLCCRFVRRRSASPFSCSPVLRRWLCPRAYERRR